MEILVKRIFTNKEYTIGHLYIDGEYFCDTLEDTDRGLTNEMPLSEIKKKKVHSKTAIPTGEYKIKMTYSPKFKMILPLLLNVEGFDYIRIHSGNSAEDTDGCLLLGLNKVKGKVIDSKKILAKFLDKIKNQKNITIKYIRTY